MSRVRGRSVSPGEAFQNNLGAGVAIGVGAFVTNYIVTFLFTVIDGIDWGQSSSWKAVGNLLYNAQFVDSEASGGGVSVSINFFDSASGSELTSTVPEIVYTIVPILVLVGAGFIAAKQAHGRLDTASAAAAGVSIVPGTAVLALLGTFLFSISQGTGSVAPELMMGVLMVGIILPAVGGAIGGVVSAEM